MGKVAAQFTMSLDGFIAGPHDEVDQIFRWYSSGDTDFPVSGTNMVFKLSRASVKLLLDLVPILLGSGIRLFDHLESGPINLECIKVIEGTGVTHLRFRVVK